MTPLPCNKYIIIPKSTYQLKSNKKPYKFIFSTNLIKQDAGQDLQIDLNQQIYLNGGLYFLQAYYQGRFSGPSSNLQHQVCIFPYSRTKVLVVLALRHLPYLSLTPTKPAIVRMHYSQK